MHLLLIFVMGFMSNYMHRMERAYHVKSPTPTFKYTWTNTGPDGGYIDRILVDPEDPNLAIAFGFAMWITRDGENWQYLREEGMDALGTFTGRHQLLLYVNDTLYYSSDGAVTFVPIKSNRRYYVMTERVSDTVLTVYDSLGVDYLAKTVDGGLNWNIITPLSYTYYDAISYAPSNDSIIYMAVEMGYSSDSVYIIKSDDGGITWNIVYSPGDVEVRDIEINPTDPQEVFVSCGFDGEGLIHTTDGFQTTETLQQILIPFDVEFMDSDSILVASVIPTGIQLGVRTPIGWIFPPADTLTTCTDIERSQDTIWYASATTGILKSQDNAKTFQRNETGLHATFTFLQKQPSDMIGRTIYFPSFQGNALYISRNGGVTWEKKYLRNVAIIFDVEAYPEDENIVYLAVGSGEINPLSGLVLHNILYSSDGGNSFTPVDTFTGNPDSLSWIETIKTVKDSPNVLLGFKDVTSDTGQDSYYLMRSNDSGHTFQEIMGPYINHFDGFAGKNPLFFQADSVIYVSYDYGASFDTLVRLNGADAVDNLSYYDLDTTLFFNLPTDDDTAYSFKLTDSVTNAYYVPGLYLLYTADNGGIYSLATQDYLNLDFYSGIYSDPFASSEQNTLLSGAVRASDNEVLLFTYGMGVYRSQDAVSDIMENKGKAPLHNILISNGEYLQVETLYKQRRARVYSVSGRLIYTGRVTERGRLNISTLPRGIYIIRIDRRDRPIRLIKTK